MIEIIDLENLSPEYERELSEVSLDIRREYIELIDSIGEYNEYSLSWLLSSLASRDVYFSPLYERCCKIAFVLKNNFPEKKIIKTSDKVLAYVLRNHLGKTSCPFDERSKVELIRVMKNILSPIRQFLNFSFELIRRMLSRKRTNKFEQDIILINIFVTPQGLESEIREGKKCSRHYYGDFESYLTDNEKSNIYFYPVFYGFKNQGVALRLLRKSKVNYLVPDDYLNFIDYAWIAFQSVLFLSLKVPSVFFREVEITSLLSDEIYKKSFSWNCFSALLNYRSSMKLAKFNINFRKLIVWSENQVTDRGLTLGFQTYLPDVPIMAYKGYPLSEQFIFHNIPSKSEIEYKVHSKNIGIIGRKYAGITNEFTSSIKIRVMPALRYADVFSPIPKKYNKSIIVSLPMVLSECEFIVKELKSVINEIVKNKYKVNFKPHPMMEVELIEGLLEKHSMIDCHLVSGDIIGLIDKSSLFVTSNSSTAMEALARELPVLILGNNNIIPNEVNNNLWKKCESRDDLYCDIMELIEYSIKNKKTVKILSEEIRNDYFCSVNRKSVENLLGI